MNSVNVVLFFIVENNLSVMEKKSNQGEKVRGVLTWPGGTCRKPNEVDHELSQTSGLLAVKSSLLPFLSYVGNFLNFLM